MDLMSTSSPPLALAAQQLAIKIEAPATDKGERPHTRPCSLALQAINLSLHESQLRTMLVFSQSNNLAACSTSLLRFRLAENLAMKSLEVAVSSSKLSSFLIRVKHLLTCFKLLSDTATTSLKALGTDS